MDWRLGLLAIALAACSTEPPAALSAPPTTSVAIGDDRLAYVERGCGEPVVFVHGGFQDYRLWLPYLQRFAPHYRAIAYSRRNHFPNATDVSGTPDFAADVHGLDLARLVEALRLGPVHVIAHSAGAHSALFFAANHPELIGTLVIVEPPAAAMLGDSTADQAAMREFSGGFGKAIAALRQRDDEAAIRLFADSVGGPGTFERRSSEQRAMMLDNITAHVADATSRMERPRFTCAMAARITAPVLLINGTRSPVFFHRVADRLAACLPNVQRVAIEASHTVPTENPAAFEAAVRRFLAAHGAHH